MVHSVFNSFTFIPYYHAMTHTNWYLFRFFPGGIYQPIISKKQHPCVFFQFQENINRFSYIWALLRWWWCSFRCSLDHLSEHITDCTLDCTVYSRLYGTYYLDRARVTDTLQSIVLTFDGLRTRSFFNFCCEFLKSVQLECLHFCLL